jgi:hypothetical protein
MSNGRELYILPDQNRSISSEKETLDIYEALEINISVLKIAYNKNLVSAKYLYSSHLWFCGTKDITPIREEEIGNYMKKNYAYSVNRRRRHYWLQLKRGSNENRTEKCILDGKNAIKYIQ